MRTPITIKEVPTSVYKLSFLKSFSFFNKEDLTNGKAIHYLLDRYIVTYISYPPELDSKQLYSYRNELYNFMSVDLTLKDGENQKTIQTFMVNNPILLEEIKELRYAVKYGDLSLSYTTLEAAKALGPKHLLRNYFDIKVGTANPHTDRLFDHKDVVMDLLTSNFDYQENSVKEERKIAI